MNFIKRLTEDYREYVDLIQPIQVAVYEMKLGLAIALSGSLQREYLKKIKEEDINRVLVCVSFCSYIFFHYLPSSISKYMLI
jgi:midasin